MKILRLTVILALALILSGCARIELTNARVELLPDKTVLTITLGGRGGPIQMLPLEAKLIDDLGGEHAAVEYTGDLEDLFGKDHKASVSGTIVFPPLDPETPRVKIDLVTLVAAKGRRYVSRIAGDVTDGAADSLTFSRR